MTQGKNKTPQAQAPQAQVITPGTLLATALGVAYGAWAVIVWGSGFSEEHLPSSPQAKAQSCQMEWGNKAPCRRWQQNRQMAKVLLARPSYKPSKLTLNNQH